MGGQPFWCWGRIRVTAPLDQDYVKAHVTITMTLQFFPNSQLLVGTILVFHPFHVTLLTATSLTRNGESRFWNSNFQVWMMPNVYETSQMCISYNIIVWGVKLFFPEKQKAKFFKFWQNSRFRLSRGHHLIKGCKLPMAGLGLSN